MDDRVVKQINPTTYEVEMPSGDKVEIGDKESTDFKPHIKLNRWDGECFIKVSLPTTKKITPILEDGKLKWKDDKREAYFYPTKQTVERRPGGEALELKDSYDVKIEVKDGVRHLIIDGVPTMSDSETEIEQMTEAADLASGDVLIGGLGLGIIQEKLFKNPRVKSITTIEISQEVIDLIKEESPELFNEKHRVIKDDFYAFCEKTDLRFDYIYADIWTAAVDDKEWNRFEEHAELVKKEGGVIGGWHREAEMPLEETDVFEFEVVLKEKPDTNKIVFDIETKGLKFYYQPELTQEAKDGGCFRPENVVGSFAVYHKTQDKLFKTKAEGEKYKAGKFGAIYRPKLVDANGWEVWGKLDIDTEAGKLTVEIPQDFLDKAVYPISRAAGLLFGYDTQGGTIKDLSGPQSPAVHEVAGSLFAGAAGIATKMTACLRVDISGSPPAPYGAQTAIYKHSDDYIITDGITTERGDFTAKDFYDFTFPSNPTVEAVDYVVSVRGEGGEGSAKTGNYAFVATYYDEGAADQGHRKVGAPYAFPDPIDWSVYPHVTNKYSIYVTYEPPELENKSANMGAKMVAAGLI